MSLAFIFISSFMVALSGAMMPGPLLTVAIKESLQGGWKTGFLITAGHGVAEVALVVLFALGLNRLIQAGWVTSVVGVLGGLILAWMGWQVVAGSIKGGTGIELAASTEGGVDSYHQVDLSPSIPFRSGMLVSLANPGWIIWWMTIGVLYVTRALQRGLAGISSFYIGHILADLAWYLLVSITVATGARFFSPKVYRWLLTVCGICLVLLAGFFFIQGVQAVRLLLTE